jgi:mono/diheme cytochrome c family protein
MKKLLRVLFVLVALILMVGLGAVSYVTVAFPKVDAPTDLSVTLTPDRIERGAYLANHVMLCMDCHSQRDWTKFSGPPIPGTMGVGGDRFDQTMEFPGVFYARNITPGAIGDWTDGELYRLITTGVDRHGKAMFPIMPYLNYGQMDPEDIYDVIAYIRSLDPIENSLPTSQPDFPFSLILKTIPKNAEPQKRPSPSDALAYGKYMTNAAACVDCHTPFEKGRFVGEFYSGGRAFPFPDGSVVRSANLTPHETGIKNWSQDDFIHRFKAYAADAHNMPQSKPGEMQTPMPWAMYSGMQEQDLAAIYTYLQSLEPVNHLVEKFTPGNAQEVAVLGAP